MNRDNLSYRDAAERGAFMLRPFPIVLALIASGLVGLGVSLLAKEQGEWLAGIAGALMAAFPLVAGACASSERIGVVIKTACTVFFVIGLIASCILSYTDATPKAYLITDGLILIAFCSAVYGLYLRKDV